MCYNDTKFAFDRWSIMEKVFDNVYMRRFFYFNIYVIKGKSGDILIDTGFICMRKSLKKWLDSFNIKLIILTHAHVDHIWNVAYLKKIYNCDVAIGGLDLENIDNSKIKSQASNKGYKLWTKLMNWGMRKFVPEKFDVDIYLKNNQIINRYGIKLRAVNLSGHTNGSVGIMYKDYLFAGDALVNRSINHVEIAYQNQDNERAKKSGLKILEISPKVIFIGHDKEIYLDKLKKSIDYIK